MSATEPGLAKVIQLQSPHRQATDRSRDVAFLRARYGERWTELPSDMGRDGLYVERLLAEGPTGMDPAVVAPDAAAASLRTLMPAASSALDLLREATDVLGEALGAPLDTMPLARLGRVAAATTAIGSGLSPEPAWAAPRAAALAEAVLQVHGPLLATSRQLHHQVYAVFTDHIWDVPAKKLESRRAAWPLVGVRRKLAAASRTGKAPKVKPALGLLREAMACRAQVAAAQMLLTTHLGAFDRGPMTDADSAIEVLASVIELQAGLGDRLDAGRLDGLLLADAFTDPYVFEPSRSVQKVLEQWSADAGSSRALEVTLTGLSEWLCDAAIAADLLDEGAAAVAAIGRPASTVRGLVNDLLVCERAAEARTAGAKKTARRSS